MNTKPAARRQRSNTPSLSVVVYNDQHGAASDTPAPPPDMLPSTLTAWDLYWASELAQTVTLRTDLPALHRLFRMYDDLERSWKRYLDNPEVAGSMQQMRISHFADHIAKMEPLVRALEDRFGLSPKSRLELGVTLGDAARSLADLNRVPGRADARVPAEILVSPAAARVPAAARG